MAAENGTWGAPRIHGELLKLGVVVSERPVSRYLQDQPRNPASRPSWLAFLRNHREACAPPGPPMSPAKQSDQSWTGCITDTNGPRQLELGLTIVGPLDQLCHPSAPEPCVAIGRRTRGRHCAVFAT
jgi:hypothetical protein